MKAEWKSRSHQKIEKCIALLHRSHSKEAVSFSPTIPKGWREYRRESSVANWILEAKRNFIQKGWAAGNSRSSSSEGSQRQKLAEQKIPSVRMRTSLVTISKERSYQRLSVRDNSRGLAHRYQMSRSSRKIGAKSNPTESP